MTYNFNKGIDRSNTGAIKYEARETVFGTPDVMPMWVADMEFRSPDCIIKAMEQRLHHGIFGYTFRIDGFFSSIIYWLKKRHDWAVKKDWILFSPGVVPSINIAVQAFTAPGDKIIVQPPVYYPFFSAVKDNGREICYNPLQLVNGEYRMDIKGLEKQIDKKVKMILLCSPQNPGGRVWTKDELQKLCAVCLKHDILIVSDEIHADLVFKGHQHTVTASLSNDIANNTITLMSPSKTFNLAGLSTAYAVIKNDTLRGQFNTVLSRLHVHHGNVFGNTALEAAYNEGENWLDELLVYLEQNISLVERFLEEHIPQIKMMRHEATYLLWLNCKDLDTGTMTLKDFFIHKAKLGLSEGSIFGQEGKGFMRMNIGCPRDMVQTALNRLKKAIETK